MLSLTRGLGVIVAVGLGVWLLLRSDRIGALRAMGLTMLLIVALGPVVQPWYLSWGLVVLAPVATGKVRTLIVGSSIAAAFIGLPAGRQLLYDLFHADPLTVAVALLVCLAILTVPLSPFDRENLLARWRRHGDGGSGTVPEVPAAVVGLRRRLTHSIRCQDGDVDPVAELPSHLPFHTDEREATRPVQSDRGLVVARDAGDHGVEPPGQGEGHELVEQEAAHPLAPPRAVDVEGVLHRGGVGGPVTKRATATRTRRR